MWGIRIQTEPFGSKSLAILYSGASWVVPCLASSEEKTGMEKASHFHLQSHVVPIRQLSGHNKIREIALLFYAENCVIHKEICPEKNPARGCSVGELAVTHQLLAQYW